jgi:hypothetical protein
MQVLRSPETSETIWKWTRRNIAKVSASSVTDIIYLFIYLFSLALQASAGYGLLIHEVSWSHTTTRRSR